MPFALAVLAATLAITHANEIRARAETALDSGMPQREAALARGFVLGEDEGIDAETSENFRRSGLSHLLAVSGQNVALLALLAIPILAAFGMPLRTRLLWVLALIAVYIPLAGAGPSIQRAAVMGALSVLGTLVGRRTSRLYALALAAFVLLLVNPHLISDIGWQLSFAAVLGIILFAAPLRAAIEEKAGGAGLGRALAEGAVITIAATLATAPLIAFHFEAISTTALLANLLVLPAVAPVMGAGMLVAAGGQVPGLPIEPLNMLSSVLLAYIAQVAAWCGRPHWAYLHVQLGLGGLFASYSAIATGAVLCLRFRLVGKAVLTVVLLALLFSASLLASHGDVAADPPPGLRVSVLDVGQGDAILLQPRAAPPILVDGGPPGDGLFAKLRGAGVERLGAAIITHDQSDHASGIDELLGAMPIGGLLYAVLRQRTQYMLRVVGVPARRVARGSEIRSGRLKLKVLWPPAELLAGSHRGEDPNGLALVLLARWHNFSMLLAADAEAETTPLDPGPVDVLKIAHHGSDDAGLVTLLERTDPHLAVISVGADNPFGHPTPTTLATLAAYGVRTLRTDEVGTVVLDVDNGSIRVSSGGG